MALNYITRHTTPSKYDSAPYGTLCYSMKDEDEYKLFVQLSKTDEARWEPIGHLFEEALFEKCEDDEFIAELLALSTTLHNRSFKKLAEILLR